MKHKMPSSDPDKVVRPIRKAHLPLAILLFLQNQEGHGYAIAKALAGILGDSIAEGTLYPLLKTLSHDGLIEARWDTSGTGPARKLYRLTDEGRAMLLQALAEWRGLITQLEDLTHVP